MKCVRTYITPHIPTTIYFCLMLLLSRRIPFIIIIIVRSADTRKRNKSLVVLSLQRSCALRQFVQWATKYTFLKMLTHMQFLLVQHSVVSLDTCIDLALEFLEGWIFKNKSKVLWSVWAIRYEREFFFFFYFAFLILKIIYNEKTSDVVHLKTVEQ